MSNELVLNAIDRQEWLDPLGDQVQQAVHQAFQSAGDVGQEVKNALHGTWLGHPVHAVVTDVPVGAWTASVVFDALEDITGRNEFGRASDVAMTVGLVGAVVAAVTGITDWSDTDGRARKVGLIHGMMNLTGALLYGGSLICRSRDKRKLGRGLSSLAYAVAFGAAYLGGELVYTEQVGVNHAAGGPPLPTEFVPVIAESEVRDGELKSGNANGVPVVLTRVNGEICAIHGTCTHAGGPLAEGKLEGNTVTCPWHASTFDVRSGKVINGPATSPEPCFETRVRDGQVEVRKARISA